MRSNLFQAWMWFAAAAVCYLSLPLVFAQAAVVGPSIDRPDIPKAAPPPASILSRARVTALYGDPARSGPFAIRFQLPAGYEVPVGMHPTDGYINVVSGRLRMAALGDKTDASMAQRLVPGAFMRLAAGARQRLWVDTDSVVELHASGPFDVRLAV
jgi:hypothetical protein